MGSWSIRATGAAPSPVLVIVDVSGSAISTLGQSSDSKGCMRTIGASGASSTVVEDCQVACSTAGARVSNPSVVPHVRAIAEVELPTVLSWSTDLARELS